MDLLQGHPHVDIERLEFLYRQSVQGKLGKYLEMVHQAHCRTPVATSMSLMEHKVRLAEDDAQRHREDRICVQRESYEKSAQVERERQDLLRKEKFLELKL